MLFVATKTISLGKAIPDGWLWERINPFGILLATLMRCQLPMQKLVARNARSCFVNRTHRVKRILSQGRGKAQALLIEIGNHLFEPVSDPGEVGHPGNGSLARANFAFFPVVHLVVQARLAH